MLLLVQQSLKHHMLEVLVSFSETGPHYLLEAHCTWVQLYVHKLILLTQNDGRWSVEAMTLIKISTHNHWRILKNFRHKISLIGFSHLADMKNKFYFEPKLYLQKYLKKKMSWIILSAAKKRFLICKIEKQKEENSEK